MTSVIEIYAENKAREAVAKAEKAGCEEGSESYEKSC